MRYLHTMIRVRDIDAALKFFSNLGLAETRRKASESGRFTLVFLATAPGEPEVELTYNWDQTDAYTSGRNFGHLAYEVDDIYALCAKLQANGVTINRPPRDGRMAFVRSPDLDFRRAAPKRRSAPAAGTLDEHAKPRRMVNQSKE